jgi:pyruvate dehydrogenase E1 component alpha subunit
VYRNLLSADGLRACYRDMVLVRRLDAEAIALQRQGELGLWASLCGQEAAQVGSARAMAPHDFAFPTYRDHGVVWCRGVDPLEMLRLFRGVTLGGWDPHQYNCHLYTIVIGAQTLHATGYAMGVQRDGAVGTGDPDRDTAVIAYFGDGATSEGDVSESFIFAGVNNAPVVFFCENNQYAISEPNDRQLRVPVYRRGAGFGLPGIRVDGNDVIAVHAVTSAALDRARRGEGPTLIEAFTYRMGSHTTSDDSTRYRNSAEVEEWRARDPLARVEALLRAQDLADEAFFADLEVEAEALAVRLRGGCRAMPDPDPGAIFDHVYQEPHSVVAADRAAFEAYHAVAGQVEGAQR